MRLARHATLLALLLTLPAAAANETKITPADGQASANFGIAVALDGGRVLVGATFADGSQPQSGKVYVYDADPGSAMYAGLVGTLVPADGETFDAFGVSVALDGGIALVGARGDSDVAASAGSAYLIDADSASATFGQELAKLVGAGSNGFDNFGLDVALADGLALVGARNSGVHLFDADPASPTFAQELAAFLPPGGVALGSFGITVALDSGVAVVGASADPAGTGGAAYLFDAHPKSATFGQQLAFLTLGIPDAGFGSSVAADSGLALVGAPSFYAVGTAHLYDIAAGSPTFGQKLAVLTGSDVFSEEQFGQAVALGGGRALVGAYTHNHGVLFSSGGAWLFDVDVASPTFAQELEELLPADAQEFAQFGWELAVDEGLAVVGDPFDDTFGSSSGATRLFAEPEAPLVYCTAKASSSGCLAAIGTSNLAAQPVSGASDYSVTATNVQEFKNGLLFGGVAGPATIPFSGGTLCVAPPNKRGPIQNSGGTNPFGCAGTFATLVNDGSIVPFGLDAGAGNSGWYQYWYRDPQNGVGTLATALSNAVQLDFQ